MPDLQPAPLRGLAAFLQRRRTALTERWMRAVSADEILTEADRLTYEQLADHLPQIIDSICVALEAEDLDQAEPAIGRGARQHGNVRWRQGYQIVELVRELDLLGQVLDDALDEYAQSVPSFSRQYEARARRLIDEARSFVTLTSIREVVSERERKIDQYTARLERANDELELKQRLLSELHESRMQITRSVVHDLRNFLNAFSIALQLISRAPAKTEAGVALASRQAADMKQLVDQMVEYSVVLGDGSHVLPETVDLGELFDELVATSRPLFEAKGLRLEAERDPGLSSVRSHRLRLKQVATNMLSNALKYTPEGEVHLTVGRVEADHWYLRVSDTGVGIAPSDQARVFNEFERAADEDIPGAGLGLAIVKELCRTLEGVIHFKSRKGHGTSFEIHFPVRLREPEATGGG
ncbi:sensor histidine kinase [Cupriavidus sp. TA19]|uniref:sensor histidine kinase n=1 Tax=Cupriavidus sp. TA19 TaxID=701108 RepID=UPI00295E72CA|nr:sensor histidine kinase [Cupriavidus sp. TA19]